MADIFLSYKREDASRALTIVGALRAEGLDVWWDQGIGSGATWREEIRRNIANARVICPLWSTVSVVSDWVIEEAQEGKRRGAVCPALIDNVPPPLGFGGIQTSNLIGWRGNRTDPAWLYFVASVRALLSGGQPPERVPPKPRGAAWPIITSVMGAVAALVTTFATLEQMGVIDVLGGWPPAPLAPNAGVRAPLDSVRVDAPKDTGRLNVGLSIGAPISPSRAELIEIWDAYASAHDIAWCGQRAAISEPEFVVELEAATAEPRSHRAFACLASGSNLT